ncbi:tryptophan synthase subunit alpha (plasmid) [Nicoliella spurrieriana]|uniref:Tryptophan synthase alpha chain n=1 Tax=Nicoliella spurrieriana TaxID=2925830 RepID=A0A976RQP6_9LACO|nr:tryptophan synthase subunit alpha [Nicoliella spurrieriana]UQS86004.1 tryptophan synthase subunit alpha [Nicoliella spurrieriana]
MSKLSDAFTGRHKLVGFVTANDPDMETTVANVVALAEGGADVVELGIPFSDPIADGPVIQRADLRALRDFDLPMSAIFDAVVKIREQTNVPLVFLTYLNIVLQYGYDAFCRDCKQFGINGLIIPDLPYEEKGELKPFADKYAIDLIPLITLNSGNRIKAIANDASGFVYLVSSLGVTGERDHFSDRLASIVDQIRADTDVPVAIGFGVHEPSQAKELGQFADGVIIGSAFVKIVEQYQQAAPKHLKEFASQVKSAMTADE